jgi:exodeoxyribonuclease-5
MELTKKQKEGLQTAIERYKNNERYCIISGYAGTGKSTLVKYIVDALPGVNPELDVVYTSFTGKATQVLAKKGNKNTSTLHKLLFISHPRPDGSFIRMPVPDIPYKVVVVDEVSMAPKSLMEQLLKYNVYIIGLGDPFQLPPVDKNEDNHLLANPHVFLDEIMRQEAESEIIQLTMKIRNNEPIPFFKGKEVQVLRESELNTGMYMWADQILVATNGTRVQINNEMRQLLGRGEAPEDGDKVICCRNYWDRLANNKSPLINGTIGTIKNSFTSFSKIPGFLCSDGQPKTVGILCATFEGDCGESYGGLSMDKKMILEGEKSLDWKTEYRLGKNLKYSSLVPAEFTYAYAITTHKSQGSEWDKVLVIEERFPFDKEEHARWLYTACTRASEKLVLVRKGQ